MLYAQEVLGLCPEVLVVHPEMLTYPWYQDRLRAKDPVLFDGPINLPILIEKAQITEMSTPIFSGLGVFGSGCRLATSRTGAPCLSISSSW